MLSSTLLFSVVYGIIACMHNHFGILITFESSFIHPSSIHTS